MFSRKKQPPKEKPKNRSGRNLSQYGLFDIPDVNNLGMDGPDEDDDDLEAELLAITGESTTRQKPKRVSAQAALPSSDLDKMVAASLQDVPSDGSVSGDDDDPDLLDELNAIAGGEEGEEAVSPAEPVPATTPSGTQLTELWERLDMYKVAEANAKFTGEAARARRLQRGVKTLNELIKQASAGQSISEEDIPPPVAVSVKKAEPRDPESIADQPPQPAAPAPTRSAPPPPVPPRGAALGVALPGLTPQAPPELSTPLPQEPAEDAQEGPGVAADAEHSSPKKPCLDPATRDMLVGRRDEYKRAALVAKKAGDTATAIGHIKVVKQFDTVICCLDEGQPVDLSDMPPPPSFHSSAPTPAPPPLAQSETQQASDPAITIELPTQEDSETPEYVVEVPGNVLEALEQRLAKYKSQEEAAKAEGNSSKARRMGRITKQYVDAIKLHRAGKPVAFDELPTPPGYPPIPGHAVPQPPPSPGPPARPSPQPSPVPTPTPSTVPSPSPATAAQPSSPQASTSLDPSPDKPNVRKLGGSRQEKQLQELLAKQKQFKMAAVQAKQRGETNQAKEYLRLAKGFDKLIEASNCGLPVDMATVPVPPTAKISLETDFDIVSADECTPSSPGSEDDILEKLEKDLIEQMKKSMETRNHFKAIGDVASGNRFEQQALASKKDLDRVRAARKLKHPVPHFHYETRSFSIVQCNTDLMDNDLELKIEQGINYNVPNPKEIDTYVRFEFPWPTEEPYRDKTATVYNTNNPVYDEKFTLPIQRNVRACQRVFKRHAIKCEVWAKGGFFRGDSLIGTALVKLQPLETKCTLHESFDLMDGRKAVGGKLEVKVRLRNPIQTKQVERVEEKWLVIDH